MSYGNDFIFKLKKRSAVAPCGSIKHFSALNLLHQPWFIILG